MDFFTALNKKFSSKHKSKNYDFFIENFNDCKKCKLCQTRNKQVPGSGPVPCNIMLIGEGPGEKEDLQGIPFIGRAGQLLTSMLETGNIKRESDIFITNIVKCRPPKNRNPEKDESSACMDHLLEQMLIIKPKILILVGSPSLKTVLSKSLTITKSRGKWFEQDVPYMKKKLKIMPIFHPSFLLRNPSKETGKPKWLTLQDILEIKRMANEEL